MYKYVRTSHVEYRCLNRIIYGDAIRRFELGFILWLKRYVNHKMELRLFLKYILNILRVEKTPNQYKN